MVEDNSRNNGNILLLVETMEDNSRNGGIIIMVEIMEDISRYILVETMEETMEDIINERYYKQLKILVNYYSFY